MSFSWESWQAVHQSLRFILRSHSFVRIDRWADAGRNIYLSPYFNYFKPEYVISSSGSISLEHDKIHVISYEHEFGLRQANIEDWCVSKLREIRHRTSRPLLILPFASSEQLEFSLENDFLLQNCYSISSSCESKQLFSEILTRAGVSSARIPKTILLNDTHYTYEDIARTLKIPFFVQTQSRGGKGTYQIKSAKDYSALPNKNAVKATEMISGNVYNFTAVIMPKHNSSECNVIAYSPSFKPMNISKLGGGHFSSVGNEYFPHIECANDIIQDIVRIGNHLYKEYNYLGLFGLDIIIDKSNYHFIEINARCQGTTEVSAATSELSGEIPAIVLHTLALFKVNPLTDEEVRFHNHHLAQKLTCQRSNHPFYIKIKAKQDLSFIASSVCRTGLYEYNQNDTFYISTSPKTLSGNVDMCRFVLSNVPSCSVKIEKNMDICMLEGIVENGHVFESDASLSAIGDKLVDHVYNIVSHACLS